MALWLSHASSTAHAAPAATDDVGAMWSDANAKLATGDYPAAIEGLTRVYETVATDPEARALRMRVRLALTDAHRGAHRVDGNPEHLVVAREILRGGMGEFGPADAELRVVAETALAELDAEIAELEGAARARDQADRDRQAQAAAEARRAAPVPAPIVVPAPIEPVIDEGARKLRRRLLVVAGVGGGVGALGIGLLAGGLGSAGSWVRRFEDEPERRDAARDAIRRGNAIGIAGAVITAVGVTTVAVALPLARRTRRAGPRAGPNGAARDVGLLIGPGRFGVRARF